jgi:hypothetical protein
MKDTFPELGFERVLTSLQSDLLAATDQEIAEIAAEIGLKPGMQGSIALAGVLMVVDVSRLEEARGRRSKEPVAPVRRRPKGEPPAN